jgi:phospholipid/cholesterol/gamma-HCH transport system substrate-binding protein
MALPVPQASGQGGSLFETIISALVIVIALSFGVYFFVQTGTGHLGSYPLRASMADASGLSVGSEVRLSGAKIGSVTGVSLDQQSYRAVLEIRIRDDLFLPVDSTVTVSASALGDIYLALNPGHSDVMVPRDGVIGAPLHPPRRGSPMRLSESSPDRPRSRTELRR